jgi:hypothetical protein
VNLRTKVSVIFGLIFFLGLAVSRATAITTIDNFTEDALNDFLGGIGSISNAIGGFNPNNVVGGSRFTMSQFDSGTGTITVAVSGGILNLTSSQTANGALTLGYFGSGSGIPNLNLDVSGDNQLRVAFTAFDFVGSQNMPVTVSLFNSPAISSQVVRFLSSGGPQNLIFPFSAFGPLDFSSINAIFIFFDPAAGQSFSVDFIQTELGGRVPEPSTLVLFMAGIAGLLGWNLRKR